jgi:predicted dehydrogenase
VAPKRPFQKKIYHPFAWRGWYDFGAGALGDMGCHIIDPVVWALELGPARGVQSEGPSPMKETFPEWERIYYDFAGTKHTLGKNFQTIWYDGKKKPTAEEAGLPLRTKIPDNGVILVGEKASLMTKHGSGHLPDFYVDGKKLTYPLQAPKGDDHYGQWVSAIRGDGTPSSNFDYSGPMTETVLLGTIACRFPGQTLRWDSGNLKFLNSAEANTLVKQTYRKGWEVEGL